MATLDQNVVAIALARQMYEARASYRGVELDPTWADLSPRMKQDFVEHAQRFLELDAVAPARPAYRPTYFDLAVNLARLAPHDVRPETPRVVGNIYLLPARQ